MPQIFSVDPKQNQATLGEDRRGEIRFTVTNGSSDELRGSVRAIPIAPCQAAWLTPEPGSGAFAPGQAREFAVAISVPEAQPAGTYSFRLDAASERNPDAERTEGPTVSFVVPKGKKPIPDFPWWILIVIALVLIVVVVVWRACSTGPPDVAGIWKAERKQMTLQRLDVIEADDGSITVQGYADMNKKCPLFSSQAASEGAGDAAVFEWTDETRAFTLSVEPLQPEDEESAPSRGTIAWSFLPIGGGPTFSESSQYGRAAARGLPTPQVPARAQMAAEQAKRRMMLDLAVAGRPKPPACDTLD